jgi:toxin-antitoxin system PIN domain toxin
VIALLDINFLIALFDAAHVHHATAQSWLSAHRSSGWATCPISENGCIRVLSQPRYPGNLPVTDITRRLRVATNAPDHTFWPDSISLCDAKRFLHEQILTPKPLTDLYLLALAVANKGRLATFDRAIPPSAVAGAQARHMAVL